VFLKIENEPGFVKFRKDLGVNEPIEIELREQIIRLELKLGNFQSAEQELIILKKKYPDSKKVRHLEGEVSEVRQKQRESN
jgi:hypothetical protein